MEKYLIARHFVNNEGTLTEFSEKVSKILLFLDLLKSYNLNFGLKLTVDENKLTQGLEKKLSEERARLPKDMWFLYDPKDRGPGISFRQILFNPTFSDRPSIITSIDIDQFPVEQESLEPLLELMKRVEADGSLYGIGSRDVEVKLATNKRNSNLRIIHELFHSLVIGSERLVVKSPKLKVSEANRAYWEIGESTTGVYVINTNHPSYTMLMNYLNKAMSTANPRGFATEYYTSIKASLLGNISTEYVKFEENKFYEQKNEQEELEYVKRLISGQTEELRKTDIGSLLSSKLREKRNLERISEFYDRQEVEFVQQLMIQRPSTKTL